MRAHILPDVTIISRRPGSHQAKEAESQDSVELSGEQALCPLGSLSWADLTPRHFGHHLRRACLKCSQPRGKRAKTRHAFPPAQGWLCRFGSATLEGNLTPDFTVTHLPSLLTQCKLSSCILNPKGMTDACSFLLL